MRAAWIHLIPPRLLLLCSLGNLGSLLNLTLIQNPIHTPIPDLRPLKHFPSLLRQRRLTGLIGRRDEEDGLPTFALALALAGLFSLSLFELLLERGGAGKLPGVDGLGDLAPEGKGLVGELLLGGREDLGGYAEGGDVDDGCLLIGGVGVLDF